MVMLHFKVIRMLSQYIEYQFSFLDFITIETITTQDFYKIVIQHIELKFGKDVRN